MRGNTWTQHELNYLENSWGIKTLSKIAKSLKRSKVGVFVKAKRLKLGASTRADEFMTARQASLMLGINDSQVVLRWIKLKGLPAKKREMLFGKKFWMIKHSDMINWLENNQEKFDSRKIEFYALGSEPNWLQEKRKKDKLLPKNRFKKWNKMENDLLMICQDKGMKQKEIAEMFGRSVNSIGRKINRLKRKQNV
jgi:hypothetical protein